MAGFNWFEKNPNYTYVYAVIALYFLSVYPTISLILWNGFIYWMLRVKNRSMWWLLPSILFGIIPVILENRSEYAVQQRERVWALADENAQLKEKLKTMENTSDSTWYALKNIQQEYLDKK